MLLEPSACNILLHDLGTKSKYALTVPADNPKSWHIVGTGELVYYKKHCVTQGLKNKKSKGTGQHKGHAFASDNKDMCNTWGIDPMKKKRKTTSSYY